MAQLTALRVLRGPDWQGGDTDGGEGYLGTVLQVTDNHRVHVLWDMGQESTCRTGQDGKFDLRVFDTAPMGICHLDTKCAECGEQDVYGILWHCQQCTSCDLCSLCYADDRHDTRHQFLRIDTPGAAGQLQSKRKISVKIRSIGLHPGAKVVRGRDWESDDQDGGQGSEGEVLGHEDAPGTSRSLLRVQWPSGSVNSYRLGMSGKVDVTCVEEEVGPFYYRDHLPLLDTTDTSTLIVKNSGGAAKTPGTTSKASGAHSPSQQRVNGTCTSDNIRHFSDGAAANSTASTRQWSSPELEEEDEHLMVGERVAIKVDEDQLQKLQKHSGGCTARMLRCIGRTGEVTAILSKDVVCIKFGGSSAKISYRFNPKVLLKINFVLSDFNTCTAIHLAEFTRVPSEVTPRFSVNDMVRVRGDVKLLKVLNNQVEWKPVMDEIPNKVGRVVKVDEAGDLRVDFRGTQLELAPACCLPVTDATRTPLDSLSSAPATGAERSAPGHPYRSGPQSAFCDIRDFVQDESRLQITGYSVRALFAAIECDDVGNVRRICQQDPSMVEREHQGITPLILASLRGKYSCAVTLIDLGAGVNRSAREDTNKTPLSAVAEGKREDLAELLLSRGADPNKVYRSGSTLSHMCALRNKAVMARALVEHGADLNIKDGNGYTPLHLAIRLRNHEVMEVLVAAPGVDIHIGNDMDFNMIQLAAFVDNPRAMDRLLARDSSQVNILRSAHSTALHIAAINDHVDCVRLLILQGGADINARQDRSMSTPLMLACHEAYLQTIEALLELGADINMHDREGHTALHLAMGGNVKGKGDQMEMLVAYRVQISNLLISAGAYVDAENAEGRTPFTYGVTDVKNGVRAFVKNNPSVVRRKGAEADSLLQSLGVSGLASQNPGRLKEALKGILLPCGVCGAPKSDVTLQPCGHRCVCRTCSVKVTRCPLCDEGVKDKVVDRD